MATSNAARASNLKYGFRRFSPPVALQRLVDGSMPDPSSYGAMKIAAVMAS
jgi:hypothetical protein